MNTINGRVIVKETRAGVADLLIVIYDADPQTIPEEVFYAAGAHEIVNVWQMISGDRLGSVVTDEKGKFELKYEDSEFQIRNKERRPDLVLFVVAPEDASMEGCPRILHISCGMRQNAGRVESYLIKLGFEQLKKAGVLTSGAPTAALELSNADDVLLRMKTLDDERHDVLAGEKPISQRYRERQAQLIETMKNARRSERAPQSFDLPVPLRIANDNPLSAEATLSYDQTTGGLLLQPNASAEPLPLAFGGVKYSHDTPLDLVARDGVCFLIDQERLEFHLSVPRSPNTLAAPGAGPGELYKWYQKQVRLQDASTSASPVVENSTADSSE